MSDVCQFSKGFFIETTEPISSKFHMQPSSKGGQKVNIFCPGHMTKMAVFPNVVKTLKIFFSRTTGLIALKLGTCMNCLALLHKKQCRTLLTAVH